MRQEGEHGAEIYFVGPRVVSTAPAPPRRFLRSGLAGHLLAAAVAVNLALGVAAGWRVVTSPLTLSSVVTGPPEGQPTSATAGEPGAVSGTGPGPDPAAPAPGKEIATPPPATTAVAPARLRALQAEIPRRVSLPPGYAPPGGRSRA